MPTESFERRAAYITFFLVVAANAFSISFFQILSLVFMGFVLIDFLKTRRVRFVKPIFFMLLCGYLAINLISLTQTDYLAQSLRGAFRVFRHLLLCLSIVYILDTEDKIRRIFYWFAGVGFVIALDALIQGASGYEPLRQRVMTPYYLGIVSRLTGPFNHANDFSAYLTVLFFIFLGLIQNSRRGFPRKTVLFFWTGLLAVLTCLAGTYSRGAWIAVAISCLFFAVAGRNKWLAAFVLVAILWAVFLAPPMVKNRLSTLLDFKQGTVHERKELWGEALRMIREKPFLGRGVNTYAKYEPFYKNSDLKLDDQYAHNGYLHIAVELGLLGLLSFLVVMAYALVSGFKCFVKAKANFLALTGMSLIFGILAFLIHSATDTNLQSVLLVNLLWISVGLVVAIKGILERRLSHP